MVVSSGLSLRDALERFAAPDLWTAFVAGFDNVGEARVALFRAVEDTNIHAYYRNQAAALGDADARNSSAQLQSAKPLIDGFRERVQAGELIMTCLQPPSLTRERFPAQLWQKLHFNLGDNSATGCGYRLEDIQVSLSPEAEVQDVTRCCEIWLRRRRAELGDEPKDVLSHEARVEFGDALSVRAFNEAYHRVYGRQRGRPRRWDEK